MPTKTTNKLTSRSDQGLNPKPTRVSTKPSKKSSGTAKKATARSSRVTKTKVAPKKSIFAIHKRFLQYLTLEAILVFGTSVLIASTGLFYVMAAPVQTQAVSAKITCLSSTASSINLNIEFSDAGTAGTKLYRLGLTGSIAEYPKDADLRTLVHDNLTAGSKYTFQLRQASTSDAIANMDCITAPLNSQQL